MRSEPISVYFSLVLSRRLGEIEETITLGIEWHGIVRLAQDEGETVSTNVDTFYESR